MHLISVRKILTSQVRMVFSATFAGRPQRWAIDCEALATALVVARGHGCVIAWRKVLPHPPGVWQFRLGEGPARLLGPWRRTGAPSGREPARRLCWQAGHGLADAE